MKKAKNAADMTCVCCGSTDGSHSMITCPMNADNRARKNTMTQISMDVSCDNDKYCDNCGGVELGDDCTPELHNGKCMTSDPVISKQGQTVIQAITSAINARKNCIESGNTEWRDKHEERIETIVKAFMPSGSGFDSGTTIDLTRSNESKVVFNTSYHHMNENGFYDGWTEHRVTVRPAFTGFTLTIIGRNRNNINEYIYECFDSSLGRKLKGEEK